MNICWFSNERQKGIDLNGKGGKEEIGSRERRASYVQDTLYEGKKSISNKKYEEKFKLIKIKTKARKSKVAMYWDIKPEELQRVSIVSNSQPEPGFARFYLCSPLRACRVEVLLSFLFLA